MKTNQSFPRKAVESLLIGGAAAFIAGFASASDEAIARYIDDNTDRIPKQTVVPVYPQTARRDRVEGQVQVCYYVDRKGRPYNVAVRKSSNRIFERPALRAIKASRYHQLQKDEQSSKLKTCRTFLFELEPIVVEKTASSD